jgi:hypothetical protein
MKKTILTLLLLVLFTNLFSQVIAYKSLAAFYRNQESLWDWKQVKMEYDELPIVKIYHNNSEDLYSKIDRLTINNSFKDDFRFPYKGVTSGNGVLFTVFDNKDKKIKIFLDFSNYDDEETFDLVIKYNNIEYAYILPKSK